MLTPGAGPAPDGRFLDRLDLSDETRTQIERIRMETDERTGKIHERLAEEVDALRALMDADDADTDEILIQAARVEDLRKEAHLMRLEAIMRVRALLTPDERAELDLLRQELRPRPGSPPRYPGGRPYDRCPDHRDHHRHGHHGGY
jgi:Spy/CpxP family protein refolding chaperone